MNSEFFTQLKDFIDFLKSSGKSSNTIRNIETDLNCFKSFIATLSSTFSMRDFNSKYAVNYEEFLDKKYTSNNSKRRRIQTLRTFCDFLIKNRVMDSNPAKGIAPAPKFVDIPRPTLEPDLLNLWDALLEDKAVADTPLKLAVALRNQLIFLCVYCGCLTSSDLTRMRMADVLKVSDFEHRILITRPRRDPYSVPMPPIFSHVLREYEIVIHDDSLTKLNSMRSLFFSANAHQVLDEGLTSRGIEVIFKNLSAKLKTPYLAKSIRQAGIYAWLLNKNPPSLIKEWLGVAPNYSLGPYTSSVQNYSFGYFFLDDLYAKYH